MKPRTVPARMSAKRRAQFEAEGRVPYSTIRKEKPCISTGAQRAESFGCATKTATLGQKSQNASAKIAKTKSTKSLACIRTKRIPPRKKRTGTPIRSKPYPGALDPKSHIINGRTVLYGKDLENLRREVFIRAFGMCEAKQHVYDCPLAVGWRDGELDHIRARGNGGGWRDDTKENTRWLSPACHKSRHGQY